MLLIRTYIIIVIITILLLLLLLLLSLLLLLRAAFPKYRPAVGTSSKLNFLLFLLIGNP